MALARHHMQREGAGIVQSTDSPDEACRPLQQHYRMSGLKEENHLTQEFNSLEMEPRESPKNLFLWADLVTREL